MKEKKPPKTAPNPSAKDGKQSKKSRSAANAYPATAVLRHGCMMIELNPGQSQLLETLSREFSYPIAVTFEAAAELEMPSDAHVPGLADFLVHQLRALGDRQAEMEALWLL